MVPSSSPSISLVRALAATLVAVALAPQAEAQDVAPASWPQFRGPGGLAVAEGEAIARDFGPERGVLWRTEVPAGQSSPCIHGDLLVVTGHEGERTDLIVALDRTTGKERWRKSFEGEPTPDFAHVDAGPALPTPCTDGERIVAYFGGYGLVAVDFDGKLLWERRLPDPGFMFGVGASPVLVDGIVVLPRDGAPEAALMAFDAEDGSDAWKVDRFDYGESHGSPFVWRNAERTELVIGGTSRLCSFDPKTGAPLWMVAGITVFPCTTPTADRDTLYFGAWSTSNATGRSFWEAGFGRSLELTDTEVADPSILFRRLDADGDGGITLEEMPESRGKDAFAFLDYDGSGAWDLNEMLATPPPAPGKNMMVAVSVGGEGDVTESHVRWSWTRGLPYVASPLLHAGRVWLVKAGGIVTCLDAQTGEPVFARSRLSDRSEYYLSPIGVGDVVIAGSAEGTLYLIDAKADELSVVHSVEFDEGLFATPAVIDGVVYLRTKGTVWAFGAQAE